MKTLSEHHKNILVNIEKIFFVLYSPLFYVVVMKDFVTRLYSHILKQWGILQPSQLLTIIGNTELFQLIEIIKVTRGFHHTNKHFSWWKLYCAYFLSQRYFERNHMNYDFYLKINIKWFSTVLNLLTFKLIIQLECKS